MKINVLIKKSSNSYKSINNKKKGFCITEKHLFCYVLKNLKT